MAQRGQVLVAILNNRSDFDIAQERHWYRIPISSADKWLKNRWPPQWLAFYQTKIFGDEAYSVSYYGKVVDIRQVSRRDLFPDESEGEKTERQYHQIFLDELRQLTTPIISRRLRRIVFIPTTWGKFQVAGEINDLFDESPLEDMLWVQLKRLSIFAERQELVEIGGKSYFVDFAIYCANGKLAVETDGDTWHANPRKAAQDNVRDNDLTAVGWNLLRFNTCQIKEQMAKYCVPAVVNTVNTMGGVDEGGILPRKIGLNGTGSRQLGLFH
jgi:very-short-patch-repair endonuclease